MASASAGATRAEAMSRGTRASSGAIVAAVTARRSGSATAGEGRKKGAGGGDGAGMAVALVDHAKIPIPSRKKIDQFAIIAV
jgi:hypothetical protein